MVPTETTKSSSPFVVILFGVLAVALMMGSPFLRFSDIWQKPLIVVGKTEIYEEEFKWLFLKKLRQRQSLSEITETTLGQHIQYVVGEIVKDAAVREEMNQLGIQISDRYIKQLITKYPDFHDQKGQFSERKFRDHLQDISFGLKRFFALEKERVAKRRLQHAVLSGFKIPKAVKELVEQAVAQKRTVRWKKYEIKTQDIRDYNVSKKWNALRTMYEERKLMSADAKRVIMVQLKHQDDIVKVEEELSSGKTLQEVAKALKLPFSLSLVRSEEDLTQSLMGKLEKSTQQAMYTKLQKMEAGGTPELFQDKASTYLTQVHEHIPARVLSFEEARPQLIADWNKEFHITQLIERANRDKKTVNPKTMTLSEITWLGEGADVPPVIKRTALELAPKEWRVVPTPSAVWLCYLEDIEELYVKAQESREILALLQEEWKQQVWQSYVLGLLKQYPKTVKMEAIEKVLATWKRNS
jgi:hypothetical protein